MPWTSLATSMGQLTLFQSRDQRDMGQLTFQNKLKEKEQRLEREGAAAGFRGERRKRPRGREAAALCGRAAICITHSNELNGSHEKMERQPFSLLLRDPVAEMGIFGGKGPSPCLKLFNKCELPSNCFFLVRTSNYFLFTYFFWYYLLFFFGQVGTIYFKLTCAQLFFFVLVRNLRLAWSNPMANISYSTTFLFMVNKVFFNVRS